MKVLSVNVSLPRDVVYKGRVVSTGIFKAPLEGRIALRRLNLDGDAQADLNAHGGIYKAVYVYTIENYDHWKHELQRDDFTCGQFGENLTVEGMTDDAVNVGDVYRIGSAVVEVTQPRVPCFKLGIRMKDVTFPKQFLKSCRIGFYLRVIEEGEVGAGDSIERIKTDPHGMSVRKICDLLYHDAENLDDAKAALQIEALSPGWRGSFEERLQAAGVAVE